MKIRTLLMASACMCSACSTIMPSQTKHEEPARAPVASKAPAPAAEAPSRSMSITLDGYKRDLARQISAANASKVYPDRPQALLRSVIVIKYMVGSDGQLLSTDVLRSNRDRATEATALASLRNSAPFPKPLPHLVHNGRVEISETWLFNDDGRFQLRTVALPQVGAD